MTATTRRAEIKARIQGLSHLLAGALLALALLHPAIVFGVVVTLSDPQLAAQALGHAAPDLTLAWGTRAAVTALTVLPALVLSAGLLALRPALAEMRAGRAFGQLAFRGFSRLATAVIASTLVKIAALPLATLLLSWHLEDLTLALSVGLQDLHMLALGAALWLIAWVMAEGYDLASENAQFI